MASKSWPRRNSVQCRYPLRQLGRHTDPIISAEGDCRFDGRKTSNRKSEERKRSRGSPSPSTGPSHQALTEASCSNGPGTSPSGISRAAFEAKYEEGDQLGEGAFGCVFAGHRKADKLPVATKHIHQSDVDYTFVHLDGKIDKIPLEVALLLTVKPAAAGTSAVIELLDWYNVDNELILVLERPVACKDLHHHIRFRQSSLQEHEAKTITKQLVDALIDIHSKGVVHCDIKPANILIETGSDVPRVKIIDFGCSAFLTEGRHVTERGTFDYTSPDIYLQQEAEPMTVSQVGEVLWQLLDWCLPLNLSNIMFGEHDPHIGLSLECQGFLRSCWSESPEAQPSLERLRDHPWLQ